MGAWLDLVPSEGAIRAAGERFATSAALGVYSTDLATAPERVAAGRALVERLLLDPRVGKLADAAAAAGTVEAMLDTVAASALSGPQLAGLLALAIVAGSRSQRGTMNDVIDEDAREARKELETAARGVGDLARTALGTTSRPSGPRRGAAFAGIY